MEKEERADAALSLIKELRSQLAKVVAGVSQSENTTLGYEQLKRWKERAVRQVGEQVNPDEGNRLANKQGGALRIGDPVGNFRRTAQSYDGFLVALLQEISEHPEDILDKPILEKVEAANSNVAQNPEGKAVFLVHGHDELNLLRLKELLRDRYALEPIVLGSQAGKGRSIIEKFEDEAQRAAFAFVLLTPDDVISKSDTEYSQARPNVIFELGWFYGRLGRDRVCILFKRGTKIHSDLDGVSRIEFNDSVVEKVAEIERELIAGKMSI